jgi:hypothetical protein
MSDFVNYKKRSVTLPPGCKDLVDVLRSPPAVKGELSGTPIGPRINESLGTIADLERYAQMLFGSKATKFMLGIRSADDKVTINAIRDADGRVGARLCVPEATDTDRAVRKLFADRGLALPQEQSTAFNWVPDEPVYQMYDVSPLAFDASGFVALLTDVFRQVIGLNPEAQLAFFYGEIV